MFFITRDSYKRIMDLFLGKDLGNENQFLLKPEVHFKRVLYRRTLLYIIECESVHCQVPDLDLPL